MKFIKNFLLNFFNNDYLFYNLFLNRNPLLDFLTKAAFGLIWLEGDSLNFVALNPATTNFF